MARMLMAIALALTCTAAIAAPPALDLGEDRVTYADLDNDGTDEAIVECVTYAHENGDRSRGHALRIYRLEPGGRPLPIASLADGHDAWGELQNWRLDRSTKPFKTVEVTVSGGARLCCDDYYRTYYFQLDGNRLSGAKRPLNRPAADDLSDIDLTQGLESFTQATVQLIESTGDQEPLKVNVRTGTYLYFRGIKGQKFTATLSVESGGGFIQIVDVNGKDLAPGAEDEIEITLPRTGAYGLGIFNAIGFEWTHGWVEEPLVGSVNLQLSK